jgi:2,5-diketo-D-gluconate reductase B
MLGGLEPSSANVKRAIPRLGLGTFGRAGAPGLDLIIAALELGYRHIDTAQTYNTEEMVGLAVRRSGILRDDLFITTKVHFENLGADQLRPSFERSLELLKMDYVDLLLAHWPSPNDEIPMESYLADLHQLKSDGQTRLIGVSNFTRGLVDRAVRFLGPGTIANNQIEVHPFLQNASLRSHCHKLGVSVTGYVPLAKGRVANDPTLQMIGARHNRLPSQIALAWAMQAGVIVIPASASLQHLRSNFMASEIELSKDEMEHIAGLDRNMRIISPPYSPQWDP